jgi:hypothetical protein
LLPGAVYELDDPHAIVQPEFWTPVRDSHIGAWQPFNLSVTVRFFFDSLTSYPICPLGI